MDYDIIIVGAGASGLIAAAELAKQGHACCVLEASERAGGRIHTVSEEASGNYTETGAEFIHGNLPLTLQLLQEAGIAVAPVSGNMIAIRNGRRLQSRESYIEYFIERVNTLKTDLSLSAFLSSYFAGEENRESRKAIENYAHGYDLADPARVSVFSLRDEWSREEEEQFRIREGYTALINYLLQQCRDRHVSINFNEKVTEISCLENSVSILTATDTIFTASKVIVTVSVAVLQNRMIQFNPYPRAHFRAIDQLGFGSVIKFLLFFKRKFWQEVYPGASFFISDEEIPTWWTQDDADSNLLTGWLGGPPASHRSFLDEKQLLAAAITSLSRIFRLTETEITNTLIRYNIICWENNLLVKGGYSYTTIDTGAARKLLSQPFEKKVYFAGEALYDGTSQGTVEAALQSGSNVAHAVQEQLAIEDGRFQR